MILQLLFVLTAIIIGARLGGIGLGVMGGVSSLSEAVPFLQVPQSDPAEQAT